MGEKFRTGNLAMPENLVMPSAYTVRTDFGSRGKKLSRVVKGVPDMYVFVIYFEFKKQSKCSRNNTRTIINATPQRTDALTTELTC